MVTSGAELRNTLEERCVFIPRRRLRKSRDTTPLEASAASDESAILESVAGNEGIWLKKVLSETEESFAYQCERWTDMFHRLLDDCSESKGCYAALVTSFAERCAAIDKYGYLSELVLDSELDIGQ